MSGERPRAAAIPPESGSGGRACPAAPSRAHADALHEAGRLDEAIAAYGAVLARDQADADAWFGLGCARLSLRAFAAARDAFEETVARAPGFGPAWFNLAKCRFETGLVEAAIEAFGQAAADPSLRRQALGMIACIIPGSTDADNAAVLAARRLWVAGEPAARNLTPPARRRGGKPRIGYLSSFFGDRNWMKPVFALLNRHDRRAFALHLLADGAPPDAASGYADHDEDHIHDLDGVPNGEAARIIAGLDLDILVDLNGYSRPARLGLIAHHPARLLVGWFNMFATSGLAAYDWLIGDEAVLPSAEEAHYGERIHRLPGSYLAFEVLYDVPEPSPPPCLASGVITFGCLGSQYKFTPATLDLWARILRRAPDARLFLKNGALGDAAITDGARGGAMPTESRLDGVTPIESQLGFASTSDDLRARLAALGVAPSRVTTAGRSPHFEFLDAYRHVDIALDTIPYNGGTTTTEALWQGVPVLACDGDRWAGRTSRSLLLAAGLGEWVTADAAAYVERAVSLALDPATPARLAGLRAGMRKRLRASAVCDADGLCRAMETFFKRNAGGQTG